MLLDTGETLVPMTLLKGSGKLFRDSHTNLMTQVSVFGSHVERFDTVERICKSSIPARDGSRDRRVTRKLEGYPAWGLQPSGRNKRGCLINRVGRENQLLKVLFHTYAMEYMYPPPPTHTQTL